MILKETVAAIADAIREKTGKSELIKPVDFAEEIKGISVGGSGESASNMEYFQYGVGNVAALSMYAQYIKFTAMDGMIKSIAPYSPQAAALISQFEGEILAFGLDFNERIKLKSNVEENDISILESLAQNGVTKEDIDAIPRITKEQFYDLNA